MRHTAFLVGVATVAALVAGCAGDIEPDVTESEGVTVEDYYAAMRGIPGFEEAADAELDEMAQGACELIDDAVAAGESNMEAVDRVYRALVESGASEADAIVGTMHLVGANCPTDISD